MTNLSADISTAYRDRYQQVLSKTHWGWTRKVTRVVCAGVFQHLAEADGERRAVFLHRLLELDPDKEMTGENLPARLTVEFSADEFAIKHEALNGQKIEHKVLRSVVWILLNAIEALARTKRETFLGFLVGGSITWKDIPEFREVFR